MLIAAFVLRQLRLFLSQVKRIVEMYGLRLLTKTVNSCVKATKKRNTHSQDSNEILV